MELNNCFPLFNHHARPKPLTLFTLHGCIIPNFFEADVSQVENTGHYLQHQGLLLREDPNHIHRMLEEKGEITHTGGLPALWARNKEVQAQIGLHS